MAIDQARENHLPLAVEFFQLTFVVLDPGMAKNIALPARGNDFAAAAENGGVFGQANIIQRFAATRTRLRTKSEELADVG
jgi:hypothetical protein